MLKHFLVDTFFKLRNGFRNKFGMTKCCNVLPNLVRDPDESGSRIKCGMTK